MSDSTETCGVFRLPESLPADLERMGELAEKFQRGELAAAEFQAFRVPQGVYEERQSGRFMLRVRLPGGVMLPAQMRRLADVAERHGSGVLHVTTRQDIQVHKVPVEAIHPALTALAEVGLSTKGGGGNTVRNITACPCAGVCASEAFDVTGHVLALTEFMLADPLSFQMPRKYKIAFSGCGSDCAGATVNDLGFIAKRRDGVEGFAVYVAGGMGSNSRPAVPLEQFIPVADVCLVAEAVKRVFDKHGNRKDKRKARLRYVLARIGADALRELYATELAALRQAPPDIPAPRPTPAPPEADGTAAPDAPADAPADAEAFGAWREANVAAQKQPGRFLVEIPLHLGDISAADLRRLADVVQRFGEGMVRATQQQNFVLRWVPEGRLAALFEALDAVGLAAAEPPLLRRLVACTGASTCRLGICLSRGLAAAVRKQLAARPELCEGLDDVNLHVNGCPNACGRHPIAAIGLVGAARRVGERLVPHYTVHLGGRVGEGRTRLAERGPTVPARNVPTFLAELLAEYRRSEQFGDFHAFLDNGGRDAAERLAEAHAHVPDFQDDKNFYYDWGAEELFSLAGRAPGECSAGVFDLIEVDLATAADRLAEGRLYAAAAAAARALLVTQGEQADNDIQAFTRFRKHFLDAALVPRALAPVVAAGLAAAEKADPQAAFDAPAGDVRALVTTVRALYDNMGPSLRFVPQIEPASQPAETPPAPAGEEPPAEEPPAVEEAPAAEKDFRGVACPLNYVKVKLALEGLQGGEILSVALDGQGAKNVPDSAANDGHEILSVRPEGDHWRILIRKKSS